MKKADNFNASKWLTENKITFQSRLNEMATMIKKNSPFGSEKPLQVGDTIMWKTYSNDDRGMGSSVSGRLIGKVVKILGTANLQAEDIKTGDLYKVSRTELTRVPNVGDKIEATLSYNSGAGSGSQGSNKISGIVKKVNPEKFSMIIQTENSDKPTIFDLKDLSDVKIYGLDESKLNEDETVTIEKIESGRDTGMAFGAIGAGYIITLSNNTTVESDDEDLLDRYSEIRKGGRKSLDQLNKILVGKSWDTEY
jgi:hypothetical protein